MHFQIKQTANERLKAHKEQSTHVRCHPFEKTEQTHVVIVINMQEGSPGAHTTILVSAQSNSWSNWHQHCTWQNTTPLDHEIRGRICCVDTAGSNSNTMHLYRSPYLLHYDGNESKRATAIANLKTPQETHHLLDADRVSPTIILDKHPPQSYTPNPLYSWVEPRQNQNSRQHTEHGTLGILRWGIIRSNKMRRHLKTQKARQINP